MAPLYFNFTLFLYGIQEIFFPNFGHFFTLFLLLILTARVLWTILYLIIIRLTVRKMQVKREQWNYDKFSGIWVGKYKNSHNMPHWHYDCELLFVKRGNLKVWCNQTQYPLSAGQAFFIDSEQVHFMHAGTEDTEIIMLVFNYDKIKPFTEKLTLASPVLSKNYGIDKVYKTLLDELREKKKFYSVKATATVQSLTAEIFRNEQTLLKKKSDGSVELFKELLTDINKNYEFYDLNTAAEFMNMNAAYFSRMFHKCTGTTFSQYLNRVKCSKAVEILQSGQSITMTEVSLKCGFATIRNFNRIFKEITGYTPKKLPSDYVIAANATAGSGANQNPTLDECVLLESSEG